MTYIREIYGSNFGWQHKLKAARMAGALTRERYLARCKIQSLGYWPGRYAKVIRG